MSSSSDDASRSVKTLDISASVPISLLSLHVPRKRRQQSGNFDHVAMHFYFQLFSHVKQSWKYNCKETFKLPRHLSADMQTKFWQTLHFQAWELVRMNNSETQGGQGYAALENFPLKTSKSIQSEPNKINMMLNIHRYHKAYWGQEYQAGLLGAGIPRAFYRNKVCVCFLCFFFFFLSTPPPTGTNSVATRCKPQHFKVDHHPKHHLRHPTPIHTPLL